MGYLDAVKRKKEHGKWRVKLWKQWEHNILQIPASVHRKIFTAASHIGKCSGYHMLTTFYFAPSSQLPNISHLLCLGQKSPLIIILLCYILVLPKSLSVCGCLKVLKGGCWNDTVWCQQGWYQRAWDGNKCRIKLGSKIQKQLQVRMNKC